MSTKSHEELYLRGISAEKKVPAIVPSFLPAAKKAVNFGIDRFLQLRQNKVCFFIVYCVTHQDTPWSIRQA